MSVQNEKEFSETVEVQDGSIGGITWTPEEEKKLVRKIDLLLLPTIWIMYLLSYMDRTKYAPSRRCIHHNNEKHC